MIQMCSTCGRALFLCRCEGKRRAFFRDPPDRMEERGKRCAGCGEKVKALAARAAKGKWWHAGCLAYVESIGSSRRDVPIRKVEPPRPRQRIRTRCPLGHRIERCQCDR